MKNIWWAKSGEVYATDERFLEFVLELCKNGLPIYHGENIKEGIGSHHIPENPTARFQSQWW